MSRVLVPPPSYPLYLYPIDHSKLTSDHNIWQINVSHSYPSTVLSSIYVQLAILSSTPPTTFDKLMCRILILPPSYTLICTPLIILRSPPITIFEKLISRVFVPPPSYIFICLRRLCTSRSATYFRSAGMLYLASSDAWRRGSLCDSEWEGKF